MFSFLAVTIPFFVGTATFAQYQEAITGQSLIGSHFGVPGFNASFDYVVVGAGTAGLAMATRLAEDGRNSVAVIEGGSFYEFDNGNLSSIPAYASYYLGSDPLFRNPQIDWGITSKPQEGLDDRTFLYAAGRTLGGSSARNLMLYHRGTKQAYQQWADAVGDQSYTFEALLPYFKKSISFSPPNAELRLANATMSYNTGLSYNHSSFSATGEPVKVSYPNWVNALSTWQARAFSELGLPELPDLQSGNLLGHQYVPYTLDRDTQTRSSSETSFLRKALLSTLNLSVYKTTLAKRILFDPSNKATGVLVNTAGIEYAIMATREVIVSAGTLRSPQLLMVSGIGPKATLDQYDIPVISDRPGVGQNMWDHVLFGANYELNLITHSTLANPEFNAQQVSSYLTNRTGQLTNIGADILGFEKIPLSLRATLSNSTQAGLAQFPADWPELELTWLDAYSGYQKDLLLGSPQDGKNYGTTNALLVAPFSRGNVTINSTDTADMPIISPNYLLDPRDREVAVAGFKRARQVAQTNAIQSIVIGDEALPGSNVTTDAQILEFITQSASTLYHAAATNAMGRPNDSNAVVDSQARVIGVSGLRVVDASAFPFLPPGHPQATVYALAEKIASQILGVA